MTTGRTDLNEKRWKATIGVPGGNRATADDKLGETDINNEDSILSSHANQLISGKFKTTRESDIKEEYSVWSIDM